MEPVSTLSPSQQQIAVAQSSAATAQSTTFDAALGLLLANIAKPATVESTQDMVPVHTLKPQQTKQAAKRRELAANTAESTPDIAAMNAAQLATRPTKGEVAQADAQAASEQTSHEPASRTAESARSSKASASSESKTQSTSSHSHSGEAPTSANAAQSSQTTSTQFAAQSASQQAAQQSPQAVSTVKPTSPTQSTASASTASSPAARVATIGGAKSAQSNSSQTNTSSSHNAAQALGAKRASSFKSLLAQAQPVRHAVHQREVQATALRAMQLSLSENGGYVTLRMNPGDLGVLHAKLTVQDARVNAHFIATTDVARDLLNQSVDTLRSALETRGLSVDSITISGPEGQSTVHTGQDAQSSFDGGASNFGSHSRSDGESDRARTPARQLAGALAETQSPWTIATESTSTARGLEWIV